MNKHNFTLLILFLLGFQPIDAQKYVDFSIGGNYTNSSFPSYGVGFNEPRFGYEGSLSLMRQIKPKFELGLGIQAAQRSYFHSKASTSGQKVRQSGFQYRYIGLAPQFSIAPISRLTCSMALPVSYLFDMQFFDTTTKTWDAPLPLFMDLVNRYDVGLQPSLMYHISQRLSFGFTGYFGFSGVLRPSLTDANGKNIGNVKDRNTGLSFRAKVRLFTGKKG